LMWDAVEEEEGLQVAYYVVYAFKGKQIGNMNDPANILTLTTETYLELNEYLPKLKGYYTFVVTSVNRYRKESNPVYAVTRRL
jgi:hypothetical protein